nr:hypothetical protein [Tanacetum cinerariifolium]
MSAGSSRPIASGSGGASEKQRMTEAIRVAVQIQTHQLHDSYQRENDEFLRTINENMKRIIKKQVKSQVNEQVSRILPRIEQSVNAHLDAEVLTRSSHSSRTSYAVAADLSEMELKKILIEKMEGNKSIKHSDEQRKLFKALVDAYEADKTILDSYGETVILKKRRDDDDDQDEGPSVGSDRGSKRRREGKEPKSASASLETATRSAGRSTTGSKSRQHPKWFSQPKIPPTLIRDWNKTLPAVQGSTQTWISEVAKQADSRSSFNEVLDTPLDFSNFIMNRLKVDTLTPELLTGPTFELMKGSCTSLIELEYHLEEVYKATTDQLDWVNPKGQQYPHNLLQPLLLITDNRGRRVIPFAHFINNDLEYLRGGASRRKYTTSVTKLKAADYGNIKWIEDLKPQQFYGFAVNRESALDVYSKRRIIAVTDLKIVEWHSYMHLDWITIRRDDDRLYKFKEGDFKSEIVTHGFTLIVLSALRHSDNENTMSLTILILSKSAYAEEPVQTTCQMEETPLSVYETGADDQPIVQTSQHPEWFSQPRKPPSLDRAWNTALPVAQGNAQS